MAAERIDIRVSETGSRTVKRNLEDIGRAGEGAGQGVALLQKAMLGLGAGAALLFLRQQVDAYTNLQNRLKLVTTGTENLRKVNDELFASANRTRSEYEATGELYASLARSSRELGVDQQSLLAITETVNQAIKISGTEASTAANGLRQLGQGLASGTLRGDELNSILENMPRLAEAIAVGMGKTVGQLRALGAEGKITARDIIVALRDQAPQIAKEFEQLTPTIADSFTVLRNNVLRFIGDLDQATGLSAKFASAVILLSSHLTIVVQVLATVALAFALFKAAMAVSAILAYVRSLVALEVALGATSVRLAAAGIGMKAFQGIMATALSTMGLLTIGVVALSAGLVYMASNAAEANQVIAGFGATTSSTNDILRDVAQKARDGGLAVDTLSIASSSGAGWANALASAYGNAAEKAHALAQAAREAAVATANAQIFDLEQKKRSLQPAFKLGGAGGSDEGQMAVWGSQLFGGPSMTERQNGIAVLDAQIKSLRTAVDLYKQVPDKAFDPKPLATPTPVATKGTKKGGGGGADTESRVDVIRGLAEDLSASARLSNMLDENLRGVDSALAGVDRQLKGRKMAILDETEVTRMRELLRLEQEAAQLAQVRDGISRRFLEPQKEYERTLKATDQLLKGGLITMQQANEANEDARYAVLALGKAAKDGIERGLIMIEKEAADEAYRLEQALTGIWREAKGPMMDYEAGLDAVNELLDKNRINAEEATIAILKLGNAYNSSQNDFGSGIAAGRDRVQLGNMTGGADRVGGMYEEEYNSANNVMRDLNERMATLKTLMQDDPINSGQYAERLRELSIEALIFKGNMPNAGFFDGLRGQLAQFVQGFKGLIPGLTQAWGGFFRQFADGAANSIGRAIVYGENLGQALKNVAKSAIADLISSLVKLALQWVIMKVLGIGSMATTTAASVAAGAATAVAWAPAAAMVSLATFGANAGPAMAGIAITNALTMGLAGIGAAAGATAGVAGAVAGGASAVAGLKAATGGYVSGPGTGTSDSIPAWLSNGEFVMNAASTSRFLPQLMAMNAGSAPRFAGGGQVGRGRSAASARENADGLKVIIEDHVGADIRVERVSRDEVRIIAREIARGEVAHGSGTAVAKAMQDPNSGVSKALSRTTSARPRRN